MSIPTEQIMKSHVKAHLKKLCKFQGGAVSAGRLAKAMKISRGTTQKYLNMLVGEGRIAAIDTVHVNNQRATLFYVGEG